MIKKNIAILISCVILSTLAGCNATKQNNNDLHSKAESSDLVSGKDKTNLISEPLSEANQASLIKPGDLWLIHDQESGEDHSNDGFIWFGPDNKGSIIAISDKIEISIEYDDLKQEGESFKTTLHQEDMPEKIDIIITRVDDLNWLVKLGNKDENTVSEFSYVKNIDNIDSFYSTNELKEWVTQYYELENDKNHSEIIAINEPNGVDVTFQIPQSDNDNDDETIVATYKVNRFTSQLLEEGKDLEKEVFLNQFR